MTEFDWAEFEAMLKGQRARIGRKLDRMEQRIASKLSTAGMDRTARLGLTLAEAKGSTQWLVSGPQRKRLDQLDGDQA